MTKDEAIEILICVNNQEIAEKAKDMARRTLQGHSISEKDVCYDCIYKPKKRIGD